MITRVQGVTLTVSDLKRAIGFYTNILGFRCTIVDGQITVLECGGFDVRIVAASDAERSRLGEPRLDLAVEDIDRAFRDLKNRGVHFIEPPHEAPDGRRAPFCDPDGNRLELFQAE